MIGLLARSTALGLAILACCVESAGADPAPPMDLQVWGGEWHAEKSFKLTWTNPVGETPLAATHYRVRDPQGTEIDEVRLGKVSDGLPTLPLPPSSPPGSYTVEVWLEDAAGRQGRAATAPLRFDEARPPPVELGALPAWVGRTSFPLRIRIERAPGMTPISGIRGYALSLSADPPAIPCLAADRCTDAETTLHGGEADDRFEPTSLPQGTIYLGAVAVSGSGMKSASVARATLRVDTTDPTTQLSGIADGWVRGPVALRASATDAGAGMKPQASGPQPFTAISVDEGTPKISAGDTVGVDVVEEGVHKIAYYARDAAGNADDGATVNGIADRAPRVAWVWIDRTPPAASFANSQDPDDPDLLRIRVGDSLSGIDSSRGRIGVRRAGSGDRFAPLPTVAVGGELRARWDSDAYPWGEYEFEATAYDLAGNATTTARRRNGSPMTLSNPLKTTTAISARFHRGGRRRLIRFGRGVALDARLTGDGRPLSGAPVRIVERFADGTMRVSGALSGADGEVTARAEPGPSRTIAICFDGAPTLSRSAAEPLELGVRGGVRLHASAAVAEVGGAPIVFRGRLLAPSGSRAAAGKAVQLQFRLAGARWSEFRSVETNASGRFRYAYRFSDDDSRGARFQFRAYAPAQEDWPYEPGGSQPVLVTGR